MAAAATVMASNLDGVPHRIQTLRRVERLEGSSKAMALHHAYGRREVGLYVPHSGSREMARRVAQLAKRGS